MRKEGSEPPWPGLLLAAADDAASPAAPQLIALLLSAAKALLLAVTVITTGRSTLLLLLWPLSDRADCSAMALACAAFNLPLWYLQQRVGQRSTVPSALCGRAVLVSWVCMRSSHTSKCSSTTYMLPMLLPPTLPLLLHCHDPLLFQPAPEQR
jgi:hypothetical protein